MSWIPTRFVMSPAKQVMEVVKKLHCKLRYIYIYIYIYCEGDPIFLSSWSEWTGPVVIGFVTRHYSLCQILLLGRGAIRPWYLPSIYSDVGVSFLLGLKSTQWPSDSHILLCDADVSVPVNIIVCDKIASAFGSNIWFPDTWSRLEVSIFSRLSSSSAIGHFCTQHKQSWRQPKHNWSSAFKWYLSLD